MASDLLARRASTSRSGGIFDYVSASRLNLWLKCPLAFRLKYVDRVELPTPPAVFVGKTVHTALERYYRQRQLGARIDATDLLAEVLEGWEASARQERVAFASVAEEQAARRQTRDLVRAYLAEVPADEPPAQSIEEAFEAPLIDPEGGEDLGIPLVGVLDLVLAESRGPLVADFKTTARGGAPLEVQHEVQLSCYSYLLRHATSQREAGLEIRNLVKTKAPQIRFHRFPARSDVHFRRLFALVRAYLDDLHAGRFVFRPGLGCSMCDFQDSHCREWDGG